MSQDEVAATCVQPSNMELTASPHGAAAAATASATVAMIDVLDWNTSACSLSLAELQKQFKESLHSEQQAATTYLLKQGWLLMQMLQLKRVRQPEEYGQPPLHTIAQRSPPVFVSSQLCSFVLTIVQCAPCTEQCILTWIRATSPGAVASSACSGMREHTRCSRRFVDPLARLRLKWNRFRGCRKTMA
jgi:hypothetical protein